MEAIPIVTVCRYHGPMRRWIALIALGLFSVAGQAQAWNAHGHMLIAAVAWQELTPRVRMRVGQLLKLNPDYQAWTAGVPDPEKAHIAFLQASTWPDVIRSAPGYANDTIAGSGPAAAQNIGYADHLVHPYWHYRDEPISSDGSPTQATETPNASTQIEAFTETLRSKASDDVKSYDLAWLEHLVGDVHQPLHAVSRFSHDAPNGDHGGGLVSLCDTPGCRAGLHGYWDGALGPNGAPQEAISEAEALPGAPDALANISDDRIWLHESAVIARNTVYAGPIGTALGPYKVTPAYEAIAHQVARGRAAVAGRRLAALLNANLR
jgi:hypothetical protein